MKFIKSIIPKVFIIEPKVFGDTRGYFFESFNQKAFEQHIGKVNFVQDNESQSARGVLRGLHFQKPPFTQAKLVRCIAGTVLDVAVDLRQKSSTFGQYVAIELSAENKMQLFIPRGFAHGFVVLSKTAIFSYKVDNWYAPNYESGIIWNDIILNIDWQLSHSEIRLSSKDKELKVFNKLDNPF